MLTGGMWLRELDRDQINVRSAPVELSHDLDFRPCFLNMFGIASNFYDHNLKRNKFLKKYG